MVETIRAPKVGEIVCVRQRQYLVEEVVAPATPGDATLVYLSCLDDDAQGQELAVLWEAELDSHVLTGAGWDDLAKRGFDPPKLFSAHLHTLRWNCVTATNPRLFQSPFRAGIKIDYYQLEPLRKALLLPRVNLFIADDVGLGKTIEAGLIARELLLRKKVRDIVVSCPPSVLPQWKDELEQRFGLTFEVLDKDYIIRVRRERGYSTNPWDTHTRFLISHRLLIDEAYTAPMRAWLSDFRPGSLLILDEAHHAAPSSGSRYAIDSNITRAIRDLAPRFEHRLFLTATPHNGHSNSFSALLEILDPQRFCRGVPVKSKKLLEDVMVRRLKEDIREVQGGFPRRNVKQVDIDNLPKDAPELRLSVLLDEYRQLREERLKGESKRKQTASALLVCGLQQRLLSSIEAFARTLRVHRRTIERQRSENPATPPSRPGLFDLIGGGVGSEDDRAELDADALEREEDAQFEAATIAGATKLRADETGLLDEMTRIAEESRGEPDARIRYLLDWIMKHMCPGSPPKWNDTRVLIFTEYEDTLRYLRQQIAGAIAGTDQAEQRIEVYHGPTPQTRRKEIQRAFNADPRKYPLRILLATDAGREGINLQTRCSDLFHFDVPWNPSRLEQRNGRIDRKLQQKTEVNCYYFVYKDRAEDRVLRALVRKTDIIKRELGSLAHPTRYLLQHRCQTEFLQIHAQRFQHAHNHAAAMGAVRRFVGPVRLAVLGRATQITLRYIVRCLHLRHQDEREQFLGQQQTFHLFNQVRKVSFVRRHLRRRRFLITHAHIQQPARQIIDALLAACFPQAAIGGGVLAVAINLQKLVQEALVFFLIGVQERQLDRLPQQMRPAFLCLREAVLIDCRVIAHADAGENLRRQHLVQRGVVLVATKQEHPLQLRRERPQRAIFRANLPTRFIHVNDGRVRQQRAERISNASACDLLKGNWQKNSITAHALSSEMPTR
jgi:SNF2 family DNA or RNA helicase